MQCEGGSNFIPVLKLSRRVFKMSLRQKYGFLCATRKKKKKGKRKDNYL